MDGIYKARAGSFFSGKHIWQSPIETGYHLTLYGFRVFDTALAFMQIAMTYQTGIRS